MIASHPLSDEYQPTPSDERLVARARSGERTALEELLDRHRPWIFNLALRMFYDRADAEDATQETLVKILVSLASFRGESAFRTWAYRIAANHFLDRRRSAAERAIHGFDCYGAYLEASPDEELPSESRSPEARLLVEEARLNCLTGMLLCLDRDQRLVFVLGEIFEVSDGLGAEVLGLSRDNFRQRLTRARRQLEDFMNERCGLLNPEGSCRCARKTQAFIRQGIVDPEHLRVTAPHLDRLRDQAQRGLSALQALVARSAGELFRAQPLFEPERLADQLRALLEGQELGAILALDPPPRS